MDRSHFKSLPKVITRSLLLRRYNWLDTITATSPLSASKVPIISLGMGSRSVQVLSMWCRQWLPDGEIGLPRYLYYQFYPDYLNVSLHCLDRNTIVDLYWWRYYTHAHSWGEISKHQHVISLLIGSLLQMISEEARNVFESFTIVFRSLLRKMTSSWILNLKQYFSYRQKDRQTVTDSVTNWRIS